MNCVENGKPQRTGSIVDKINRMEVILKLLPDDIIRGVIMKEDINGAVALTIDYSNGVRKSFNSFDEFIKNLKLLLSVIPAKAGIR